MQHEDVQNQRIHAVFNDLAAQTIVGNHSANGQFNHSDRILGKHIACVSIFIAAQITGVTEVNFLDQFLARQTDLVSIDDDDMIPRVHMGRESWFMFTAEHLCDFGSKTAEGLIGSIHYVPLRSMVDGVAIYVFILIPPK